MGSFIASRSISQVACHVLALSLLGGCGDEVGGVEEAAHADVVVDALSADPADALLAINGVYGGGSRAGSTDVLQLGYEVGVDNAVTLRWSGRRVTNGPGADLVVFENAFAYGDGSAHFLDAAVVEVSRDGVTWVAFPHDYRAPDETTFSSDPADWSGFAGLQPVRYHEVDNRVDPFSATAAGGDHFDLDDLPLGDVEAEAIRRDGFVFLRLVTAPSRVNPDTGALFVRDAASNGADIDGVYARYFAEDADATGN